MDIGRNALRLLDPAERHCPAASSSDLNLQPDGDAASDETEAGPATFEFCRPGLGRY